MPALEPSSESFANNPSTPGAGEAKKLAHANAELARNDDDVAKAHYGSGIEHYRNAWIKAEESVGMR